MLKRLIATLVLTLSAALAVPTELKVNLMVGQEPLKFGNTYQTPTGFSYQIDLLKFYISEVALVRADGTEVKVDGLALADFKKDGPTQGVSIMKLDLPAGEYSGLRFNIGVPRELNHQDASLQKAPLGVDSGMYWAWNPGYIFYRLEGRVMLPQGEQKWVVHMGTDAFRLTARLQDLQTRKIKYMVGASGGSIGFNLDVAAAFNAGPGGVYLDWNKAEIRQLHGLSPVTRPMMAIAYYNMTNAFGDSMMGHGH
jgi:hypothetical protein